MKQGIAFTLMVAAGMAGEGLYAAKAPVDVSTIVHRSVQANDRNWQVAPEYQYYERDRTDGAGKTYCVSMILGSPYRRLVEENGKPLSRAQEAEEQSKLESAVAHRRAESAEDRARRIKEYREGRQRDHVLIRQLSEAFNFQLVGRQKLSGREVYVLQASPRAGYKPPNRDAAVLAGMRGKLWVDTQTFQWVKVEAIVVHPVQIDGFLAQVQPGTRFELDYAPVNDDVWLPTHFAMKSEAKVLFVFSRRDQADESYFKYQKAAADGAEPGGGTK